MASGSTALGQESAGEHSALINVLRVVRERWWLVVVSFVVCAAITVAITLNAVKQYTATATLLIRPSNLTTLIDPTQTQDATTRARVQSDNLSLISSGAVAALVKQMLSSTASISDLQGRVNATAQTDNDLLNVSVTDPSPSNAAKLANAFATALVTYLRNSDQAQIAQAADQIKAELRLLPANDTVTRPVLSGALSRVEGLRAVSNGDATLVDAAQVPSSPSSASAKRNGAIGSGIGIILGIALAFLFDLFDRRVKSSEELDRRYGLPVLASIPFRRQRPQTERDRRIELEPFRILRDSLTYVSLRDPARVVLVTSAVPEEGKTRVAAGLARAAAVGGRNVALVEADLHRPAIAAELGLKRTGRGLTSAIVDDKGAAGLMTSVPGLPTLSVLLSGTLTPSSSELLRSESMTNVLAELAEEHDLVILDGPPLLPVADAQVLLDDPTLDVCLIVARPNLTTREAIRGSLAIIERHPEKGMGLVVNAVREASTGYNDYAGASVNGAPNSRRRLSRLIRAREETRS
jgi:capsular exopolysaccharide synthesis family protein